MDHRISPSADGRSLAINNAPKPWKSLPLHHKYNLPHKPEGVRSVNVSSDDKYLIITNESRAGKIRVVDMEKLAFLSPDYAGHTASARLTSINKSNTAFYTGSWDGTARRFEIVTGNCTEILYGFGRCPTVFIDANESYLFTGSYDTDLDFESGNTGRCWDLASRKAVNFYPHNKERQEIECMDIAYDQEYVYTGSDDGCSYLWPMEGGAPLFKYFECNGSVRKVAVSSKYFAAACTDGVVRLYKKLSAEPVFSFQHAEKDIREVRISLDEKKLYTGGADGSISCFNIPSGELIYHRQVHTNWIWSMCLMHGDRVLVTGSRDGTIGFLSTETGEILAQLYNLPDKADFLITCPPDRDRGFPMGLFFTTNTDLVQVLACNEEKGTQEILNTDDIRRETYLNKLNLKNLVITRLKNNGRFQSFTEKYYRNRMMLNKVGHPALPLILK